MHLNISANVFGTVGARPSVAYVLLWFTVFSIPVSIAGAQFFLALASLCWVWQNVILRRRRPAALPFLLPLALCVLTTLLAVLVSPNVSASAAALKKFALFIIPFLVLDIAEHEEQVHALLRALFAAGAGSGVVACLQYPGSLPLHRASGFLGHWQSFAGQQMMLVAMLVSLLLFSRGRRWFYAACLVLSAAGLLLSETRGPWLATGGALLLLAFVRDKRLPLALAGLVVAGYFVLPSGLQERVRSITDLSMESNAARLNMWSTGLNMIRAHPWLGVGPNQVTALAYQYGGNPRYEPRFFTHLHNNFLQFAAERGIPGLIAWIWLLTRFYWDAIRLMQSRRAEAPSKGCAVAWGVLASLVAVTVAGMVEFNLGNSLVLMLLLFLMGCVYALTFNGFRQVQPTAFEPPRAPSSP